MSTEMALQLAARGCHVFRIKAGTKAHFVDRSWSECPISNALDVYDAFTLPGGRCAGYNYGVNAGASDLLILDIDVKGAVDGVANLATLGSVPPTFTVRTPSGGLHYYFRAGGRQFGQADIAPGVQVRSYHGYVVGPGSRLPNGVYTVENDVEFAPLPDWIAEKAKPLGERPTKPGAALFEPDSEDAIAAATGYVTSLPVVAEGQRNDACCDAARLCLDFGCSPERACEILTEHFVSHPPMDASEIEGICDRILATYIGPIGKGLASFGFEPIDKNLLELVSSKPSRNIERAAEISLDDMVKRQANALIKDLLYPGEFGIVYGASGSGKSFITLDMAFHIAHGKKWCGLRVKRGPVLYVALEGVQGFRQRVLAARNEFGDPGNYFARLSVHASLVRGKAGDASATLIATEFRNLLADTGEASGLIVIDTLARAIAGDDENAMTDMSHFLEHRAGLIARETGAAVLVVHHTGKDGRMRGSTSFNAAAELTMRTQREGDRRTIIAEKVKDGQDGQHFNYRLERVVLGADADGDAITSCVVRMLDPEQDARANNCTALAERLMRGCIRLSDNKFAPNYAPRWLAKNQGTETDFTEAEFETAVSRLTGLVFEFTNADNKGREVRQHRLIEPSETYAETSAF